MQSKSTKNIVLAGAARFNAKPKTGLVFLEENGIIYRDLPPDISRPKSLAMFLKSCTRLDKKLLGDFISKPDNIEVLKEFLRLFDFKGVSVVNFRHSCVTPSSTFYCYRKLSLTLCVNCLRHSDSPVNRSRSHV